MSEQDSTPAWVTVCASASLTRQLGAGISMPCDTTRRCVSIPPPLTTKPRTKRGGVGMDCTASGVARYFAIASGTKGTHPFHTTKSNGTNSLSLDMTRSEIQQIQTALNAALPDLPRLVADGLIGAKSKAALMAWETRRGLAPFADFERAYGVMFGNTQNAAPRSMDAITVQRIAQLHPKVRQMVTDGINEANAALTGHAQVRIVQGLRTMQEQAALYAQGRTTPGSKVTNAKPGQTFHNYGLAFDIALLIDGKEISWSTTTDFDGDKQADWMEVVAIFKRRGWTWGGDFKSIKDAPHFEFTFGYSWQKLQALYNARKVDSSGYVVL